MNKPPQRRRIRQRFIVFGTKPARRCPLMEAGKDRAEIECRKTGTILGVQQLLARRQTAARSLC